jgi:hypothetical protein
MITPRGAELVGGDARRVGRRRRRENAEFVVHRITSCRREKTPHVMLSPKGRDEVEFLSVCTPQLPHTTESWVVVSRSQGLMSEQFRAARYKISSQIGTGTFGTVFSARDRTDNSRIAVKVWRYCTSWPRCELRPRPASPTDMTPLPRTPRFHHFFKVIQGATSATSTKRVIRELTILRLCRYALAAALQRCCCCCCCCCCCHRLADWLTD